MQLSDSHRDGSSGWSMEMDFDDEGEHKSSSSLIAGMFFVKIILFR